MDETNRIPFILKDKEDIDTVLVDYGTIGAGNEPGSTSRPVKMDRRTAIGSGKGYLGHSKEEAAKLPTTGNASSASRST